MIKTFIWASIFTGLLYLVAFVYIDWGMAFFKKPEAFTIMGLMAIFFWVFFNVVFVEHSLAHAKEA